MSLIHGDFHADQLVVNQDRVSLIDFDNLSMGNPCSDLASWIAQLELSGLASEIDMEALTPIVDVFLSNYEEAAGARSVEEIQTHLAVARLLLIDRPFRLRLPEWPEKMDRLMSRIEQDLKAAIPHVHNSGFIAPAQAGFASPGRTSPSMADSSLPMLSEAFDADAMTGHLRAAAPLLHDELGDFFVETIRMVKHKAGRRCLIEYGLKSSSGRFICLSNRAADGEAVTPHVVHLMEQFCCPFWVSELSFHKL